MKKKKRGHNHPVNNRRGEMSPEFKKHANEIYGDDIIDLDGAPDEMRLSAKILRLIDPYVNGMDIVSLVALATIAWNECIYEDFGYKSSYSLNSMVLNYEKRRDFIDELKSRKRMMFNSNRSHIKEIKVYEEDDDISINVVSDFDIVDMLSEIGEIEDKPYETYSYEDDEEFEKAIEMYEDDGDISKPNPYLKHTILSVVDNQLRDNTPPIARETFERLQTEGYTAKQAKEKIAAILLEEIYEIMTTKKPHDEKSYETRLKTLK